MLCACHHHQIYQLLIVLCSQRFSAWSRTGCTAKREQDEETKRDSKTKIRTSLETPCLKENAASTTNLGELFKLLL